MKRERAISSNPLLGVKALGQSIWLDFIRRKMMASGELAGLIREDGLAGITSNPVIFEQAISHSDDYNSAIAELRSRGAGVEEMYDALVLDDIARAADIFRPSFESSDGQDGFVSHEVSPRLAHDSDGTIREARRLWDKLGRPNILIKVPGTVAGLRAITELIAAGINVNITLLFSVERYEQIAAAYFAGLERRIGAELPLDHVASVASFFLSRIDQKVDPLLDQRKEPRARALRGRAAEACAKLAYQSYRRLISSERWKHLATSGARPQRLLWASMGTKDASYSDVKYVDALIGPNTVATLPLGTLNAYRDHGSPEPRIEHDLDRARALPQQLGEVGIDLSAISAELEGRGHRKIRQALRRATPSACQTTVRLTTHRVVLEVRRCLFDNEASAKHAHWAGKRELARFRERRRRRLCVSAPMALLLRLRSL